jgi:hypothetical protein
MRDMEKILYNSKNAAQKTNFSGWLSSNGLFVRSGENDAAAERLARYDGCTHKICECGNEHEKMWTCCSECRLEKSNKRFESMEFQEWKGEPLFLWESDEYFFSLDDLEGWADDNEIDNLSQIKLLICEPRHPHEIDIDEYYSDILPEDTYVQDVAPEIAKAAEDLNKLIRKRNTVFSWYPGKKRTKIRANK